MKKIMAGCDFTTISFYSTKGGFNAEQYGGMAISVDSRSMAATQRTAARVVIKHVFIAWLYDIYP